MANQKRTTRNHAEHFVNHLDLNLKNALRVLLLSEASTQQLFSALGIAKAPHVSADEHRMGLARRGRTVELFTGYRELIPADMKETL